MSELFGGKPFEMGSLRFGVEVGTDGQVEGLVDVDRVVLGWPARFCPAWEPAVFEGVPPSAWPAFMDADLMVGDAVEVGVQADQEGIGQGIHLDLSVEFAQQELAACESPDACDVDAIGHELTHEREAVDAELLSIHFGTMPKKLRIVKEWVAVALRYWKRPTQEARPLMYWYP